MTRAREPRPSTSSRLTPRAASTSTRTTRDAEAVDIVALTRALVDIDSTTAAIGDAARRRAARSERTYDAFNVIAHASGDAARHARRMPVGHLLDALRLRAAVFSEPRRRRPAVRPRRLRCERDSGGAGRGGGSACGATARRASACCSSSARSAAATARARRTNAASGGSRFLIDGEPTDNRLGLATRGILRLKLRASGRAAHSSFPELGESAIDKLIDALVELRAIELPSDPVLGRTHYTVGLIAGGVAPNVVSPSAEAEVMFRTVSDAAEVRRAVAPLERRVTIEHVLEVPPVQLRRCRGSTSAVFPYTTDIPFLAALGRAAAVRSRLDSRRAHRRRVRLDCRAVGGGGQYVELARALLIGYRESPTPESLRDMITP